MTTDEDRLLEVQRLNLPQHVVDAAADLLALGAEHGELAPGPFGVGQARARRVDLAAQPGVLVGGPRVVRARPGQLVGRPRAFRARAV